MKTSSWASPRYIFKNMLVLVYKKRNKTGLMILSSFIFFLRSRSLSLPGALCASRHKKEISYEQTRFLQISSWKKL